MKIIAHLAIQFDPPLDEVDTTAIFKATKAATINIANDIRAAQERDENADMPDPREDPSDIVNKPQCWEKFVEGPTAREKLDRLAREMERFFLTGGEWKPADKDRHTRLTSKFEGKRLISIAKDLLQPAESATDKTTTCKRNTTNALVNIWEDCKSVTQCWSSPIAQAFTSHRQWKRPHPTLRKTTTKCGKTQTKSIQSQRSSPRGQTHDWAHKANAKGQVSTINGMKKDRRHSSIHNGQSHTPPQEHASPTHGTKTSQDG